MFRWSIQPIKSYCTWVTGLLVLLLVCPGWCYAQTLKGPKISTEELNQIDAYLGQLGLVDQQIILIEDSLAQGMPAADEDRLAKKVSHLYATQLMKYGEDLTKAKRYFDRVDQLVRTYPKADTPALRVLLLQAEYNQAETLLTKWIHDSAEKQSLVDATKILKQIVPKLLSSHQQLEDEVDELFDKVDKLSDGPKRVALEKQAQQLDGVKSRAAYFAAWGDYYLKITQSRPAGNKQGQKAIELFQSLLDISEVKYSDLEADALALDLDWRARSLIGLGLAESLSNNTTDSALLFQLLKSSNASPQIADQADYWYLQGLLNIGNYSAALSFAKKVVATYQGNTTGGKTSLCIALVQHGFRPPEGRKAFQLKELATLGIVGLAKLGHHNASIQLLEKYQVDTNQSQGFYMPWLIGQKQFAVAEKSKEQQDYQLAQKSLQAALTSSEAKLDLNSSSECRYTLAWCTYRLNEVQQAGALFQEAITGLKVSNPGKAAESAWMSFVCFQSLAKDQPLYASKAIDVLEQIKRDFPTHSYAKKADFFIAKLQQRKGSISSSIKQLMAITPSDPSYLTARYDLCVLLKQQIEKSKTDEERKKTSQQLKEAVDIFTQAAKPKLNSLTKLKIQTAKTLMMVVDLSHRKLIGADLEPSYLKQTESLIPQLPEKENAIAEFYYRSLLLERDRGNQPAVEQHADWLVANAKGTSYELTGLVVQAIQIDKKLQASSNASAEDWEDAYQIYQRLVMLQGTSVAKLKSSKNAKVSCAKLAQYAIKTGHYKEASQYLQALLAAYPSDQEYLQQAGRASFSIKDHANSLIHWRKLLLGLPKNTEAWFEAKYYQIACLIESDRETAKKVMNQFKLLHSNWGEPPWRDKMKELDQRLSQL